MSHAHHTDPNSAGNYEKTDAHIGPIVKFLIGMFVVTALVLVSMWAMLEAMKKMPVPNSGVALHPLAAERQIPSEPRLEAQKGVHKAVDGSQVGAADPQYFNTKMFKDWNKQWSAHLGAYSWVDQSAGIASIPIERAMELKLKKGFPTAAQPKN